MAEVLLNRGHLLTFLASVLALIIILQHATPLERDKEATDWAVSIEAFMGALVAWAAISLVRAPCLVRREELQKGTWHGRRYIYKEPQLVAIIRCRATGAVERYGVQFDDAEANSYVDYFVTLTPDVSHRANFAVGNVMMLGGRAGGKGGCRLDGYGAALWIEMPEDTVSTTARVFCEGFVVGNPDWKDGKAGNIGPEIRRTPEGYQVGQRLMEPPTSASETDGQH